MFTTMQQLKCLVLTCILLPLFVHGNADADKCSIRQVLRHSVNDNLKVSCNVNDICTAVHCQGIFLKNIFSREIITKQNDTICFGATINHCDKPLSLDVYLQYEAMKFSFMKRLLNNKIVTVYPNIFLFIELSHENVVAPHEVTIKVSLKSDLMGFPFSSPVVPEHTYTMPSCPAGVTKTPLPTLQPCRAPRLDSHRRRPELPHTPPQHHHHHSEETHSPIRSDTYGKPCNHHTAYSCLNKEICTFNGVCECQPGLVMNPFSGFCDVSDSFKIVPHPVHLPQNTGAPLLQDGASPKVKDSAVIIGFSVGAAVTLATLIVVVFIISKRQKNPTSHVPLIDNEEVVI